MRTANKWSNIPALQLAILGTIVAVQKCTLWMGLTELSVGGDESSILNMSRRRQTFVMEILMAIRTAWRLPGQGAFTAMAPISSCQKRCGGQGFGASVRVFDVGMEC
jgi:hypothetical protein